MNFAIKPVSTAGLRQYGNSCLICGVGCHNVVNQPQAFACLQVKTDTGLFNYVVHEDCTEIIEKDTATIVPTSSIEIWSRENTLIVRIQPPGAEISKKDLEWYKDATCEYFSKIQGLEKLIDLSKCDFGGDCFSFPLLNYNEYGQTFYNDLSNDLHNILVGRLGADEANKEFAQSLKKEKARRQARSKRESRKEKERQSINVTITAPAEETIKLSLKSEKTLLKEAVYKAVRETRLVITNDAEILADIKLEDAFDYIYGLKMSKVLGSIDDSKFKF